MKVNVEKVVSKKTTSLMIAIVLLIAGILFCISPAIGESSAGLVIGIGVLLLGAIFVVKDFLVEKSLITRGVIAGAVVAALGVYFMVDGSIVSKIIGIIPYILIVMGACVIADSILLRVVRDKENTKKFVLELIIGILAVVLGVLILTVGFFRKALAVIIGILLIAGSVYYLIGMFKKGGAEKAEADDAADAESADDAPKANKAKAKKSK